VSTTETHSRSGTSADRLEPVPTGMRFCGFSLPDALRYAILTIFLVYCILPATWIPAAITRDASFPNELIEAARLDSAGELRIFWRLGMPLMQTALVTVALLSFVAAWNNFFLPLIVLSKDELYPLTLGLNVWNSLTNAAGGGKPSYHLIALGSFIKRFATHRSLHPAWEILAGRFDGRSSSVGMRSPPRVRVHWPPYC
jgi:Binding-protein-dependent transport system inner membrane component